MALAAKFRNSQVYTSDCSSVVLRAMYSHERGWFQRRIIGGGDTRNTGRATKERDWEGSLIINDGECWCGKT
jgi:hypothetical protein